MNCQIKINKARCSQVTSTVNTSPTTVAEKANLGYTS